VRIDHVIWATADLTSTAARLAREHGLRDAGGGRHVGIGTHNRVFPLGGGYLEVLAVADADEAARSPIGRTIAAAPEGLFGWAVAAADVEAQAARLGLEVTTIERDGLTARLAGVTESMAEPWLPFFIERDPGIADPGASGDAGGIAWIELTGDVDRLGEWLGGGGEELAAALRGGRRAGPARRRPGLRRRHPVTIASSSSTIPGAATSSPAPVPGRASRWRVARPAALHSISPAAQSQALRPYS
jgi:hypothetical protein